MGLLSKISGGLKDLKNRLGNIRGEVEETERLERDIENTGNKQELQKDERLQRNVFEDLEAEEKEVKAVLSLEGQEIEKLIERVRKNIRIKKDMKDSTLAFQEFIGDVDSLSRNINQRFENNQKGFSREFLESQRFQNLVSDMISLHNRASEISSEMERLEEEEQKANQLMDSEMEEAPKTVQDLIELGEILKELKETVDEEEASVKEMESLVSSLDSSNARKINSEATNEVQKIESNLEKLEQNEEKLAAGVAELEGEMEDLADLDEQEKQVLNQIVQEGKDAINQLEQTSKHVVSIENQLPEDISMEEASKMIKQTSDNQLLDKLYFGAHWMKSYTQRFVRRSEELLEYVNREEKEDLELKKRIDNQPGLEKVT